jgi:hypothetical protein
LTVNEFVEERRREWRRLGVPDPIANEMAADLAVDIEEAESEGVEDVLGNSAFDPCRFAGSWAVARGVTAPPMLAPPVPAPPKRRWPALAFGVIGCMALLALAAAVLVGGRQSAAFAVSARRLVGGPKSFRVFPGAPVVVQHFQRIGGFGFFAFLLLVVGVVGISLAVHYGSRRSGCRIGPWEIRRYRADTESSG